MKIIDLSMQVPKIVLMLNETGGPMKPPIHLSMPSDISSIRWRDGSLELMVRRFLISAMSASDYRNRIRMEVCEKPTMKGLELFFALPALRWISFSISFQSQTRFEEPAKSIMGGLGLHCAEWIGSDNSEDQMGIYCSGEKRHPEVLLYLLRNKYHIQCDLIIPIIDDNISLGGNKDTDDAEGVIPHELSV